MEIFFDWELDDKVEQPVHKWVYEDLRKFLWERWKPLEQEIDERKKGQIAFIAVVWNENGSIETRHIFIPKDLSDKINDALTQDDMDYIMNHIGKKIDKKASEN